MVKNENRGIAEKDFKQLLTILDFKTDNGFIYRHTNGISVNFDKKEIDYGQIKGGEDGNLKNFSQKETTVVVECVCSLIKQGYSAQSIVLNPRWQVGHGGSGGIADIQVLDKNGYSYLIIECKTFGAEFDKYWKKTLLDGDQIFSYYQQVQSTQYGALYASSMENNNLIRKYHLVSFIDNKELLKSLGKNVKGYKDAQSAEDTFKVWRDVYNQEYEERGIFENNQPYDIGRSVFNISDLEDITSSSMNETDKKFKNILRQHNIGSHENAFDKLVNLFLAKIVDEANNHDDLQFNWKGTAKDDIKSLTDRIQKLYKDGMKEFLNEEVTYVEKSQIDKAFIYFENDINATKTTVLDIFDKLKYYTNNDFAFLDVHNENLFKQNAQVLLKIVQMLQNFRLKTEKHNQFLGDLFEGFLDNGVKQSEGQYFTPLPIVRFITSSLPLEKKIKESSEPLKMIDYACGAGHFLNEYANQISEFIKPDMKKQYFQNIFGIEKEYRLSKVAKVSAFMYNQDDINIIYDDALKHDKVKDNDFDILIANPPYAVSGFLETLPDEEREKYELTGCIKKSISTNNGIQTFFIERAKQLLRQDGIAGIVLPNSILDNTDSLYVKTREILLKYFDIISVCKFPKNTFGKTGTKTIVLFLRRKSFPPEACDFIEERITTWFNGNYKYDIVYEDDDIIKNFCDFRKIDYADFIENPQKYESEKEKVYFYYLTSLQKNPVIIMDAENLETSQVKTFLGYSWTERDKNYHIQYLHIKTDKKSNSDNDGDEIVTSDEGINKIKTPLFNPQNYNDITKINTLIRANYNGENFDVPDELKEWVSIRKLTDLLNFDSSNFDKIISNKINNPIEVRSKYELKTLGKIFNTLETGIRPNDGTENVNSGIYSLGGTHIDNVSGFITLDKPYYIPKKFFDSIDKGKVKKNDILICKDGAKSGKIAIVRDELNYNQAMINEHVYLARTDNLITQMYVFRFLHSEIGQKLLMSVKTGAAIGGINSTNLKNIAIPFPPIDVQKNIVNEIDALDKQYQEFNSQLIKLKQDIGYRINNFSSRNLKNEDISSISTIIVGGDAPSNCVLEKLNDCIIPVYSNGTKNKGLYGYTNQAKVYKPSITISARGTIGYIEERNEPFVPIVRLISITPNENIVKLKFLKYFLMTQNFISSGSVIKQLTKPMISNLKITFPDIKEQNKIINEILPIEAKIQKIELQLSDVYSRKQEILDKYLK